MEGTLPLLKGRISLAEALEEDVDIVRELSYPKQKAQFWRQLNDSRQEITEVLSGHLNISQTKFRLGDQEEWVHGTSNASIPVYIDDNAWSRLPSQAIIRFPLPYAVGEDFNPGNIDEKLRSDAATYLWLQKNCPEIPLPRLFGFGFPGQQSFTSAETASFFTRFFWFVRRFSAWLSGRDLNPYVRHLRPQLNSLGYLVMERLDNGKMLTETWEEHRDDPDRRANLFKGLSRVMLRLAKLPLPKIGSWTMNDEGVLTLTNRPLTLTIHQLENAEIPTDMPRDRTYNSVEPYMLDLLACQDKRIQHQPNSIHDKSDGEKQLAALAAMRALLPKFTDRQYREGPFIYSLTDLDKSNIIVDDDWNVKGITDFEWGCARPIQMLGPPDWLSNRNVEDIVHHYDEYAALHEEFVDAVEEEELQEYDDNVYAEMMRESWETRKFWYAHALDSPSNTLALYVDHIQPRFMKLTSMAWGEFSHMLWPLWDQDCHGFVASKLEEQTQYLNQVRSIFEQGSDDDSDQDEEEE